MLIKTKMAGTDRTSISEDLDLPYILALLILGLIAYSSTFTTSFFFDDITKITKNEAIRNLRDLSTIFGYCKERFLIYLTLAANYRLSRLEPMSYHIFNFFIHYAASIFLYLLFIELLKTPAMRKVESRFSKELAAFLAAGIFLLHPLQTQSVTYVIQRAESMAGMFYLATLYFYLRARLVKTARVSLRYGILTGLCALCAAFSKETAVTLPAMIAIFEIFLFETSIKDLLRNKIFLALLVPAALIVFYKLGPLLQRNFFYDPAIPFTRKQYLLTQFSVLVTYLRLFFYPAGQNIDWDFPISDSLFARETTFSLLLLLVLFTLSFVAYRRFRLVSLSILGFFITLAPTSSIIPIKDVIFEHRMYIPVAFLAIGCVSLLCQATDKLWQPSTRGSLVVLVTLIVAITSSLTGLTYLRNQVWRSGISLWKDAVEKSPNKARPHNNYGRALYLLGGSAIPQARKEFEIANRLDRAWAVPWHNLALISFKDGDYTQAIELDLKALERKPNFLGVIYQLAKSHRELGQLSAAQKYLERLIKNSPPQAGLLPAYLDLIELNLRTDNQPRALELARELVELSDTLSGIDYYRGLAWYRVEDLSQAEFYFKRQTTQTNETIPSLFMLGELYYQRGETDKAEAALRQVLVEQPWSPMAHYNLSVILEQSNRITEARKHLETVVGIQPFSLAPQIRLIGLYNHLGENRLRSEFIKSLLGLRSDSKEFSFLKDNEDRDLVVTLQGYEERFLTGDISNSTSRLDKTRAVIATLRGDVAEAINWYEKYLSQVDDGEEVKKVEKEILRLKTILHGNKEPLEVPA
jgi:tetratricopeptide (TPR) repeat protein